MARMAKAPHFHTQSVYACWKIARNDAERYQRHMARHLKRGEIALASVCRAARDVADRIALTIRYGRRKGRRR